MTVLYGSLYLPKPLSTEIIKRESNMIKKLIYMLMTVSGLLFAVNGQTVSASSQSNKNIVQDNALGISFEKVGDVNRIDSSTFSIKLPSSEINSGYNATAMVSVSNKLYVDLPGSYGGRLYLDSPNSTRIIQNRVKVDSIASGDQNYRREYWTVYAGMGMWDCVINCYFRSEGQYYIVSYVQDKQLGKPGEIIDGEKLNSDDLKSQALSFLKDKNNSSVNSFYQLLSSFQINSK